MFFNEIDPYAAQWLRNLFPQATVLERSITYVNGSDIAGFGRVHLFAGIGGWEEALRLAQWPEGRPVGTGSCPCQPFSCAGKRKGQKDERHLWPEMRRIIGESEIDCWFGEQVAGADGRKWLAGIQADLEALDFVFGAADICAAGVSAPHIRQRLFWVANRPGERLDRTTGRTESRRRTIAEGGGVRLGDFSSARLQNGSHGGMLSQGPCSWPWDGQPERSSGFGRLVQSASDGRPQGRGAGQAMGYRDPAFPAGSATDQLNRVAIANSGRLRARRGKEPEGQEPKSGDSQPEQRGSAGHWSNYELVRCGDGKTRRIESGAEPLVARLHFQLADGRSRQEATKDGVRAVILKGIGNSIVPQVAAQFIRAFLETENK